MVELTSYTRPVPGSNPGARNLLKIPARPAAASCLKANPTSRKVEKILL